MKKYLNYRIREIILFTLVNLIYLLVFYLYQFDFHYFMYPFILSMILGILFLCLDSIRVHRKIAKLKEIENNVQLLMDELPVQNYLDESYQNILNELNQRNIDTYNKFNMKYQDMQDYYTLWVHQIKTPIASMRLNLQLEDSKFSRELQSDLNRIEQYTNMVLTYLRLSSESTDYSIHTVDLDSIIKQVIRKFSNEFILRKIRLEYQGVNRTVLSDEKWLAFVIEQVLSNALKYTKEGSVSIYLDHNMLVIEDTGIGIASEDLPRVFDKGYTGFNGRLDKKASGIGLYLCKKICENLGHSLQIESIINTGTKVRIGLDRKKIEIE